MTDDYTDFGSVLRCCPICGRPETEFDPVEFDLHPPDDVDSVSYTMVFCSTEHRDAWCDNHVDSTDISGAGP